MTQRVFITSQWAAILQEEIQQLEIRLLENKQVMKDAMDGGSGMHDNAGYDHAKMEERNILIQISELQKIIDRAEVVTMDKDNEAVQIDSVVYVLEIESATERDFRVASYGESDPDAGIFSYATPFGGSFLGKVVGDTVLFKPPKGSIQNFLITSIANNPKE
jgi:transcription elongation GreA/GreB family factor